ncbi:glutamate-cysteine ligase family protein [Wukongibacter baidiensis]|uniref:glutamate--cysteine ligase n=1 Tax=Wukongibacter baidiensis TaxID=1723361 RepID=UPI003D800136
MTIDNDINYQKERIINYFKESETAKNEFKIGAEFEHFVVNADTLETISFYGENGIESLLKELTKKGWKEKYEENHLMALSKDGNNITLEPGAQVELSTRPCVDINEIENQYLSFLRDIIPILNDRNQYIVSLGYQPESKISQIPFIPKGRYKYMSEYFTKRGKYAHNMMKGTASLQITIDYCCEEDYMKKFRVANALSPYISYIFDNAPFFEGEVWNKNTLRVNIWNNCDDDRCKIVPKSLDRVFGYEDYAEYVLNAPPIIIQRNGEFEFTADRPFKDIYYPDEYTKEELEHVLTMYFPDVRTKKFIEVRMADSVPYPLNIAGVALWKGLLYNEENLESLYKKFNHITNDEASNIKRDIIESEDDFQVVNKDIMNVCKEIISLAEKGLSEEEEKFLLPLKELIDIEMTPSKLIKENLHLGKNKALEGSILNNIENNI